MLVVVDRAYSGAEGKRVKAGTRFFVMKTSNATPCLPKRVTRYFVILLYLVHVNYVKIYFNCLK